MLLGLGGEYMKLALCSLISDMSRVKVPESEARLIAHNHPVIRMYAIATCSATLPVSISSGTLLISTENWQNLLDECLINVELEVQNAGISALGHFVQLYEGASNPEQLKGMSIISLFVSPLLTGFSLGTLCS